MEDAAATINAWHEGTFAGKLGLVVLSATRDEVRAELVLRADHNQPYGIVHGGVHATLVESVASIGAGIDAFAKGKTVVGLENHTSFVRAVRGGTLRIVGLPITRGRRSQLWEVTIRGDDDTIVATGRVRLMLLDEGSEVGGKTLER